MRFGPVSVRRALCRLTAALLVYLHGMAYGTRLPIRSVLAPSLLSSSSSSSSSLLCVQTYTHLCVGGSSSRSWPQVVGPHPLSTKVLILKDTKNIKQIKIRNHAKLLQDLSLIHI